MDRNQKFNWSIIDCKRCLFKHKKQKNPKVTCLKHLQYIIQTKTLAILIFLNGPKPPQNIVSTLCPITIGKWADQLKDN